MRRITRLSIFQLPQLAASGDTTIVVIIVNRSELRGFYFLLLFLNEASNQVAFPHPQAGKGHYWEEDISNSRSVIRYLVKRTIDVTDYGNADDEVRPAKN